MNTRGFAYRILVVDDEPSVLELSALVLKERGYEVRTASDGFQALVELRRSLPDIIISDLRMPNMSGFELLSVVRRRFPHIPVIAISGEYNGESPAGLIADAFLSKGQSSPEELFHKIAELIEQSPFRPQSTRPDTDVRGAFCRRATSDTIQLKAPLVESKAGLSGCGSIDARNCSLLVYTAQELDIMLRSGSESQGLCDRVHHGKLDATEAFHFHEVGSGEQPAISRHHRS